MGRAGIFRNTDVAQGGNVSSLINALGVVKSHMAKTRVDLVGVVGEIETQSLLGEYGKKILEHTKQRVISTKRGRGTNRWVWDI